MISRVYLAPDYSISRIIKGGWHLAGGHGSIDPDQALEDMRAFVEAGMTTFDCADIYTGVEELIGAFFKTHPSLSSEVQVHTKYVPDYDALATLTKDDTTRIIDRSLLRLGVERLDLVQFAWWDFNIPGHVETAWHLAELQKAGKIHNLAVTNYDHRHLAELIDAGIPILANQVQYSILDRRPEAHLVPLCAANNISLLCYGVLAGGFLSDLYLDRRDPQHLENRSLIKYRLIIDEIGGYEKFQKILHLLSFHADEAKCTVAQLAIRYMLRKAQVAAAIIGVRNDNHLNSLIAVGQQDGLADDIFEAIDQLISDVSISDSEVYALERQKSGRHGSIMRYNLNHQNH